MGDYKTRAEVVLDEKWATTPDMGEYLDNDLLLDAAEELAANGKESMFCVEEPFAKAPGYYPEQNVFVFSGRPTFQSKQNGDNGLNKTDGDTVYLDYTEIVDNGVSTGPTFTNENTNETLKQTIYRMCGLGNSKDDVGVRLVGINAPEVPHYRDFEYDPGFHKTIQVEYRKLYGKRNQDLISTSEGLYRKDQFSYVKYNPTSDGYQKRNPEEIITFVKGQGKDDKGNECIQFFEMIKRPLSEDSFYGEYKICLAHSVEDEDDTEYFRQAIEAQQALMKLMNDAKEIVYIVDQTSIADKASGTIPWAYKKEWEKISQNPIYAYISLWKNLTQEGEVAFRQMGRRYFGQELNGRLLGAIYVKLNTSYGDQWVNVGKYLVTQFDKIEILPYYNDIPSNNDNFGYLSDAFKLWSYNKGKQHYVDALDDFRSEKGGDDRAQIQKVLTGIELDEVINHTVMVGDCLLMVPPTSIRVVSQTRSERISMLRTKGSITKTIPKNERIIEMNLFFNGDEGINGIPYDYTTPNGTKLTYHMNGLRALVSQFKFTPFLPIHNDYINYVLNIEAVSLVSYNISTVPNYPRTLQCTIRLQEFDYRQYMPELLPPDPENKEDLFTNIFSKTIHFPVMRYYYQRAILTGESIKDFEFNSDDYYRATLGQKTALQPMKFQSPMFNLYIANEEHLKQRKMLKESLERNPIESVITFNEKEEAFLKDMAKMYQAVIEAMSTCFNRNSEMFKVDNSNGEKNVVLLTRDNSREEIIYEKDFQNKIEQSMGIYHGYLKKQEVESNYGKETVYVYVPTKSKTDIWEKFMKPTRHTLLTAVRNNFNESYIKDVNFAYKQKGTKSSWEDKTFETTFCWGIEIDIDWNALGYKETLDKVRRMYAKQLNVTVNTILKDGKLFLGFNSTFKRRSKEDGGYDNIFTLENMTQPSILKDTDYDVFSGLANNFGIIIDGNDGSMVDGPSEDMWSPSSDIGEIKDNIDLESDKSIVFDEYPIGYPIINSVSFTYNNVFTNMSLKVFDGYAAQYSGGSDTAIEINMTATDEFTVNQLSNLSRICVQRLIDFRKIMSSSPLRIDSEMTRFMGVNEVVIESIDINTVPNYPGTWDISMRLMSVDRTLRNREAMKKLDIDNHENNMDSIVKTKNFFEIKNALAKVELYPDLELPTLSELEKLGYYYIRYKANGERVFPDADFYFVYLHVYSSQMFRQAIVDFFRDSSKSTTLYHKLSGNLFGEDINIAYKLRQNSEDKLDKRLYEYESNGYVKEMEEEIKRVTSLMNDPGTNKSEMKQAAQSIEELQTKVTSMNQSILNMREVLDSTNFDSYDFNSITKVSVKDKSYFSQENSLLTEETKYRVYNRKDGFKTVNNGDKVKNMNASLKELILEILSSPIDPKVRFYESNTNSGNTNYDKSNTGVNDNTTGYDKGNQVINKNPNTRTSSVVTNTAYKKLIEYISNDIGGCTAGLNTSFTFADTNGKVFSLKGLINTIMSGSSRAASAKLGIYDVTKDNKKDSEPRQVIERTLAQPDGNFKTVKYPNVLYTESGQVSTILLASNDEERAQGFMFGSYGIKKYSPDFLSMMYSITLTHAGNGFLDPYYNPDLAREVLRENLSKEDGEAREAEYIKNIVENEAYGENAFFRVMLCWLYKLLDDNNTFLPSPLYLMGEMDKIVANAREQDDYWWDNIGQWFKKKSIGKKVNKLKAKKEDSAFSDEDQELLSSKEYEFRLMETETELEDEIEQMRKDIIADLPRYRLSLLNGLFLTLSTLALTEFNTPVYAAIKSGDISTYVGYVEKIKASYLSAQELNDEDIKIRKLYQYLDYQFDNSSYTYDKINYKGPADKYSTQGKNQRIYLEAADTPSVYLMHSFYDMIMTDMRGRMARAFPTYYMLLIDEGRDLGVWRLQDNFYDVSSIVEFQVVKSRKIAADTAKIVMTNLFGTFTTEDDDMKDEYQYTFKDMWNSIMSPKQYVAKEYQRKQEARDINRAKLKPGARVHLRMGYSGDASSLPIMFNGSVAEVVPGDLITIVCQGDGVELANPAMFNPTDAKDVADLQYNDNLISSFLGLFKDNTTPRDILLNPLIAEGTFLHEIIKDWSKGRLFNANPFGISHFGDKHFKDIFTNNGEVEQNIYEALAKPSWGKNITVDTNDYSYAMSDAPKIRVGLTGNRSYWDLMHISTSVSPDFICAIAPFQMRSTIFYGHPRYYYAYDYEKLPNGQINEKRKPFQQYHIYTSYTDIISNKITASDKDVRTVAVGVYTGPGMFSEKTKSVGPLYLDIDIYPEKQKSTNINCNFEYRNLDLIPFTLPIIDYATDELGENGGYQIAWRATAMGLKDTVKDMYTGELIVMGDPSVKPYDKMFVHDIYEDIQGMAEVESVVHSFTVDTGFTTSITPDCIAAIDNKYEQISNSTIRELAGPVLSTHAALVMTGSLYQKINRALFFSASQAVKNFGDTSGKIVNAVGDLLGKENIVKYSEITDKVLQKAGIGFGVTSTDYVVYSSVKNLSSGYDLFKKERKIRSGSDLAKLLDDMLNLDKNLAKMSPDKLLEELKNVPGSKDEVKAAIKSAESLKEEYTAGTKAVLSANKIGADDLKTIVSSIKDVTKEVELAEDLAKSLNYLDDLAKNGKSIAYGSKEFKQGIESLKSLTKYTDDILGEGSELLKIVKNLDMNIFQKAKATFKSFDKVDNMFKAVNSIRKGAGALKSLIASNIFWLVAEIVLTKSLQEFLERKLKNLQVLTVFPIMKNGKVYTAGLDGNKGSVFGSPSYTETGFIEEMAIKFFEKKEGIVGGALGFLRDLFITTPEMLETVEGYRRDNGYGSATGSQEVERTSEELKLLEAVTKSNISGFTAYKQLYFDSRVKSSKSQEALAALNKYKLVEMNKKDIFFGKTIAENLVPVYDMPLIGKLSDKGVFKFVGEEGVKIETDSSKVTTENYVMLKTIEGADPVSSPCKVIESGNSEIAPVYVLPYLRQDAAIVLEMVVEEVCKKLQPDYQSPECKFEYLHQHNFVLHNGVRINDNGKGYGSWFSTGFAFTLEVKSYPEFSNIIKEINDRDISIEQSGKYTFRLLNIQKDNVLAGQVYNFWVSPKK